MKTTYNFGKKVDLSFEEAVQRTRDELSKEGFGVLTEIDVAATMKKKLDKQMPPYIIMGACNPPLAYKAIEAEPGIGALLPCNVVVRVDSQGYVLVEFMDPSALFAYIDSPAVHEVADEVKMRLNKVMAAL